jgi:hypothetical protein
MSRKINTNLVVNVVNIIKYIPAFISKNIFYPVKCKKQNSFPFFLIKNIIYLCTNNLFSYERFFTDIVFFNATGVLK